MNIATLWDRVSKPSGLKLGIFWSREVVVWLVVLGASSVAHAQSHLKELEKAQELVNERRYTDVISKVRPLLENLGLNTLEEIILAHRLLGVSHCELGDEGKARTHFDNLITLSPSEDTPKQIITEPCRTLFQKVRRGNAAYHRWSREQSAASGKFVERPGFGEGKGRRYIPYGVGQFVNDNPTSGTFFLSSEAFFTAAAVTTLVLFEGEAKNNGKFLDPTRAEGLRIGFFVSTAAAIGLGIWGIVDAVHDYNAYVKARESAQFHFDGNTLTFRF